MHYSSHYEGGYTRIYLSQGGPVCIKGWFCLEFSLDSKKTTRYAIHLSQLREEIHLYHDQDLPDWGDDQDEVSIRMYAIPEQKN